MKGRHICHFHVPVREYLTQMKITKPIPGMWALQRTTDTHKYRYIAQPPLILLV